MDRKLRIEIIQHIAKEISSRCQEYVSSNDTLGIVAVCRVTMCLAKTLITQFGSRTAITGSPVLDATRDALNKLYELLLPHATSISIYVQTSVVFSLTHSFIGIEGDDLAGESSY